MAAKKTKEEENEKIEVLEEKLIPELNIGTTGHVDHGKTTLIQALTGKWADTHSEEKKRGITIKLGYADVTFYKCSKCSAYGTKNKCVNCFEDCQPVRTVSFVDAPGHETLMATVLSGASIMDGALLVISATEPCPQPQTREHLTALDISGIKQIVVVQNKIDAANKEAVIKNYQQIKEFLKGTIAENAPIIPVSAKHGINMDVLIQTIEETIKTPERDSEKQPKMLVARSFDVNRPAQPIEKLSGGIFGGSLLQGELEVGEEIEIRPGIRIKDKHQPIKTKIVGLQKAGRNLEKAGPGGLLGISTLLDPYLTKADSLSGSLLGLPGKLPETLDEISIKITLLERVIGTREELKVDPIRTGEPLVLNVGTTRTVGVVAAIGKKTLIRLKIPICAEAGDRVAVSRQVSGRWRLVGWGQI